MKLFNLLFTTRIAATLRFRTFSPQHLFLILAVAACIVILARHTGRTGAEQTEKALAAFTISLPCIYIFKFIVFWLLDSCVEPQMSLTDRLPFHLCAINAVIMPLGIFKRNKTLLNYMYSVALPAAAAAMVTPAMSYYGSYFYLSWQVLFFYIDHGIMTLIPVLAVRSGLMRPDYRMLPRVLGLLAAYSACMYVVNKVLNENFLFLNHPDEGTVMAFFARHMGNPGYLVAMAALAVTLISLMYLPWYLSGQKKPQNCE